MKAQQPSKPQASPLQAIRRRAEVVHLDLGEHVPSLGGRIT